MYCMCMYVCVRVLTVNYLTSFRLSLELVFIPKIFPCKHFAFKTLYSKFKTHCFKHIILNKFNNPSRLF